MVISRPLAGARVADVECDELGTPAAARESETEQGSIADVAQVVSPHRFDQGAQRVERSTTAWAVDADGSTIGLVYGGISAVWRRAGHPTPRPAAAEPR